MKVTSSLSTDGADHDAAQGSVSLDEITAEVKAIMGVTDDEPRMREWNTIRNSQKDCSCCGKCGKPLASDERVFRTRISRVGAWGSWQHNLVALCRECAEQDWHWKYRELTPKSCEGCGRDVWSELQLRWSDEADGTQPVVCSERCAIKARNARHRLDRAKARGTRECLVCNETF